MVCVSVLIVITGTLCFLDINLRFDPEVCNGCHDLIQKARSFNVVIVSVKGNDYRIHFWYISKDEAINLLQNVDLTEKLEHYKT